MATLVTVAVAADLGGVGYSAAVGRKIAVAIAYRSECICREGDNKGTGKREGEDRRLEQAACAPAPNG
jgi:hypothetical protein